MTTTGIITYIQRRAPDWDRATILMLLNEVQRMTFIHPNELMEVRDPATGKRPFLTTTAGVLEYELTEQSFGWDVAYVFSDSPATTVYNATTTQKARVLFSTDPGDSKRYLVCYRQPQEISSENVQLDIPAEYHLTHVVKGVIGLLEQQDHGSSNTWQEFEKDLLPKMIWGIGKKNGNKIVYNKGGGY